MAGPPPELVLVHATESRLRFVLDDPRMAGFTSTFDTINRLARASAGFRWQLEGPGPGHPIVHPDEPRHVVNVSAWVDYRSLHQFVYRSAHGQALLHRQQWFEPVAQPATVLWWVYPRAMPTLDDALARLAYLRRYGPGPRASTLRRRFDRSGRPEGDEKTAWSNRRTRLP